ncbi:YdeI/OmpD-associated family protein [Pseudonocardia benzenivorans]|jgi:hypothetical protein|uniref:YdeI/OmpD-associated family protein n=1 Tax=Pseudonocardia benzenivorans TaxID=228005 RepID=A0ABW3V8X0_9PSEU
MIGGAVQFRTTIEATGKNTTGIVVPERVVEELGGGRRPAVSVTAAGHTWRTSIASMGGRFLIGVSAEVRRITGLAGGDDVDVEVELDTAPREVTVPQDLADALDGDAAAKAAFEALAYSHQRRHVLAIDDAKTPETRARRIAKAVEMLREGRK